MRQVQHPAARARSRPPASGQLIRRCGQPSGAGLSAWTPPLIPGGARPARPTRQGGEPIAKPVSSSPGAYLYHPEDAIHRNGGMEKRYKPYQIRKHSTALLGRKTPRRVAHHAQ
jgi:hypothetical protein